MIPNLAPRAWTALAVTATSLFLLIAFAMYGPAQAELVAAGSSSLLPNVAAWFVDLLGIGAYVLVLVPGVWGVQVYFREDTPELHTRAIGTVMLTAATAAFVGVLYAGESSFWAGAVGEFYGNWVVKMGGLFGAIGTVLGWGLAIFFVLYSLVLATDWIFHSIRRGESRLNLPTTFEIETEPSVSELRDHHEESGARDFVAAETPLAEADTDADDEADWFGAEETETEAEEPVQADTRSATVPSGWTTQEEDTGRTVLRAPSGYQGVEFQPVSEELAVPEPVQVVREPVSDDFVLSDYDEEVVVDHSLPVYAEEPVPEDEPAPEPAPEPEPLPEAPQAQAATIGYPEQQGFLEDEVISIDQLFTHVEGVEAPSDGASAVNEFAQSFRAPAPDPEPIEESRPEPTAETVTETEPAPESVTEAVTEAIDVADDIEEPRETYVDDLFFSRLPDFVLHDVPTDAPQQLIEEPSPPETPAGEPVPAGIGPGAALQAEFSARSEAAQLGGVGLDPLFHESVTAILSRGRASAVVLQSQLGIGYSRANRILDQMTEVGLTGPETPTGARDIRLSDDALREFLEATSG